MDFSCFQLLILIGGDILKCPYCQTEMLSGVIKVNSSMPFSQSIVWFPLEEKNKILKENMLTLSNHSEGCYCQKCKKVIALFDIK